MRAANAVGRGAAVALGALMLTLACAAASAQELSPAEYIADIHYRLETRIVEGQMVFVGIGGEIDDVLNPELRADPGDIVQLTLVNGDGAEHDFVIPELDATTDKIIGTGSSSVTVFRARLDDGTGYRYWTFNGTVPGPMLRARVGDTIHVTLENAEDSTMTHSVDMHAVTGPGGGAVATQTSPGDTSGFTFEATKPGVYVYHCATPMVAHHIANGMYGLVVVEPPGGLEELDEEFYVMQGEIFTRGDHGQEGYQEFSVDKLLNERPEYYVFNGAVGALTTETPLRAEVGDDVRVFFGVGGPNATSSFHVIGEIFDRVYDDAALTNEPSKDVQTTSVAPGAATLVEFQLDLPGRYILVDHALARMERGLVGFLVVEGEGDPEIFRPGLQ